jgi:hypothetical protein
MRARAMSSDDPTAMESEADFLLRLQRIAEDWRFSDEFIGKIVRTRWPRIYDFSKEGAE